MSDSDSDLFRRRESQQPEPASSPPSGRRRSTRLTRRSGSTTNEREEILTQLQNRGVTAAPGLPLSQLRDLVKHTAGGERSDPSPPPAPGRKRTRKSGPIQPPQARRRKTATRSNSPPTTAGTSGPDAVVIATLQTLVNTMGTIEAHLQHLGDRQPTPSTSFGAGIQDSRGPMAGMVVQPSTSAQGEAAQHSLASAVPDRPQDRRQELDTYMALIGDLGVNYGGHVFYRYHKAFARKAALFIRQHNIRLAWSVMDMEILLMVAGGVQPLACSMCGRTGHQAPFCPAAALQSTSQGHAAQPPLRQQPVQGGASKVCMLSARGQAPAGGATWFKNILRIHPSTPIDIAALANELSSHPDRGFVNHLLTGLSQGFHVGVVAEPTRTYIAKNLQSAREEPGTVANLIKEEVRRKYIVGPFKAAPYSVFRTNPVGIATGKYSGKKRLILDLSAPHARAVPSINSLIPPELFSLHYISVDNAISLIKRAGQGAWLSKVDVKDAFKIVPIHPAQWHLFGIRWEAKFYFAVRLTFGCRSSPCIFNKVSEALCWILLNRAKIPSVLHLLDDFLVIDSPRDGSGCSLRRVEQCFRSLGVPLSEGKTMGPATRLEFLGITLDTTDMKASLPMAKLQRIREFTKLCRDTGTISKQQLLSLLGHLNVAMRVIPQGRSFISRLLDLASSVSRLHELVTLDHGCRSDLRFWSRLLDHWNGVTFFYNEIVESADSLQLFTDAAPSVGFGGFYQGQWFASHWPTAFCRFETSIALYEIYPVAVACFIWGRHWTRKRISIMCDNQAVVDIVNKGRSSARDIMPFMRGITWSAVTNNFIITARHVPGRHNKLADSLSRFDFQTFQRLCPEAHEAPVTVPPCRTLMLS
uniref:uncharacterized protein LOC120819784 n=1 Tax=Gasterosteus aculeatus aculeatus TaxID=481459 RepID=UPI001A9830ED|nr:uncharacterized protein LOC120819784 [Gasterosteus aculeatus aculeatus]